MMTISKIPICGAFALACALLFITAAFAGEVRSVECHQKLRATSHAIQALESELAKWKGIGVPTADNCTAITSDLYALELHKSSLQECLYGADLEEMMDRMASAHEDTTQALRRLHCE